MIPEIEKLPPDLQALLRWHWPLPNPGDPPSWIWSELKEADKLEFAHIILERNKTILESQKAALDAQIKACNSALGIVTKHVQTRSR